MISVLSPHGSGRCLRRTLAAATVLRKPGIGSRRHSNMPLHHLMIGTWTPPGAIFTVQFDDENLALKLVKRTEIPHDEPISWMTFDVRLVEALPLPKHVRS